MFRHAYIYPFFQYWCSVRCARHQHYFTFSTRCTLYDTYCHHMSRGKLFVPIFRGSGPHTSSWEKTLKKRKTEFKTAQIIHECIHGEFFCHILSCTLKLPSYTYNCSLLIIGGKSGVSSAVAVHNTPIIRVTPTHIPQPYM